MKLGASYGSYESRALALQGAALTTVDAGSTARLDWTSFVPAED